MSEPRTSPSTTPVVPEPSAWSGVVAFGGVVLSLAGLFHLVVATLSFFGDTYVEVPSGELVVTADYPIWGAVHVVVGLAALAAGVGILNDSAWARALGVGVAAVSAVVALLFIAASPWASTIIIAVDVLVIYALVAHGHELAER